MAKNLSVRLEMMRLGVQQQELAQALGISKYTLCRWLATEMDTMKKQRLLQIVRRLGGECSSGTEKEIQS